MCNQFDNEIIQLYKKGMMCDIQKTCVYIYFVNNLYHHMRWWTNDKDLTL